MSIISTSSAIIVLFAGILYYLADKDEYYDIFMILNKLWKLTLAAMLLSIIYHYTGFHKYFGFFKRQEPSYHLNFTLKTFWVVILWGIGQVEVGEHKILLLMFLLV